MSSGSLILSAPILARNVRHFLQRRRNQTRKADHVGLFALAVSEDRLRRAPLRQD